MSITEQDIRGVLSGVVHPDSGAPVEVKSLGVEGERVRLTLLLPRARDPFARSVRREVERAIFERFPQAKVDVTLEEPAVKPAATLQVTHPEPLPDVGRIVAVSSAKGGVGKSTVTANLALALHAAGWRVGVLDADIYGPSQPILFDVEGFRPEVDSDERLTPAFSRGVALMSIGFFINAADALVWRGPMATSALKQLIHQTRWPSLDCLLIDLPPGTGDVHLTLLQSLRIDGAVVVTTPQQLALADAERGIALFRSPAFHIPILGLVENMAWFTPAEHPDERYYLFGRDGGVTLAQSLGIPLLGQIPVSPSCDEAYEALARAVMGAV